MPLKPIPSGNGRFGIALFNQKGDYISPSHQFSGKDFSTEAAAQKAIENARKKFDREILGVK